jgi:hypothetical protein
LEYAVVAVASVLLTATCYDQSTGYVTGGFITQIKAGVFSFNALSAYCDPGYAMGVNVTSLYNDVKSTYFRLEFRFCVRGEYYQDSICIACEDGTNSFTDPATTELSQLSNSHVCVPCPRDAKSCYGNTIELKYGFWRISDNSSALLARPYGEQACGGGVGSGDSLCHQGYVGKEVVTCILHNPPYYATFTLHYFCECTGPVCAICDDGYAYHSLSRRCELCNHSLSHVGGSAVLILLAVIILVAGFGYVVRTHNIKNVTELYMVLFSKLGLLDPDSNDSEQQARIIAIRFKSILKIFVTLWQIVAIMPFTLDMVFPDIYSAILVGC